MGLHPNWYRDRAQKNGLYRVPEKSGRIYEAVQMHKIHGNQEDSNAAGKMAQD